MSGATFSENWYRVSGLRVGLLPTVQVHKQRIRGHDWYFLGDTYLQSYFRVTPEAYAFLARLSPRRTVDEVWQQCIEQTPQTAPGQEEVSQLLSQLHLSNLLYYKSASDSTGIFERDRKRRQNELRGKLLSFLFVRIPLWDPDEFLTRIAPLGRGIFSLFGALCWLIVLGFAVFSLIGNGAELMNQGQGVLALANLPWLYLCLVLLKITHEMGHGLSCKRYGGAVHTFGLMFLVFVPLPYMDATASWSFRHRYQRIVVSSAGMLVELFLAGLAAIIWAATGAGLVHSLAFNVMLIGSLSSLLFNGNPLLRYDAYFILSDLIDIPNLSGRATSYYRHLAERYLLGNSELQTDATDFRERAWLLGYGFLSVSYRLLITFGILLFVTDQLFAVGIMMLLTTLFIWVVRPLWKWFEYLCSPHIHRFRTRAVLVSVFLLGLLFGGVGFLPLPYRIVAPGVVEAVRYTPCYADVGGLLQRLEVSNGEPVSGGQVLAVFKNIDLERDLVVTRQSIREVNHLQRQALSSSPADVEPLLEHQHMLENRLSELLSRKEQLVLRANEMGVWVADGLRERIGSWISRGELLGQIVGTQDFRFTAMVEQEQADELFNQSLKWPTIRFHGQSANPLKIAGDDALTLIPYQRDTLASAALGWAGGGNIAVSGQDQRGEQTAEAFFELRTILPAADETQLTLFHGLSGELRIDLSPQSLFRQVKKELLQLLQKRYEL